MPVLPGNPPVEVHLRRSARARRFSLRVSRLTGKVTLTLPARAREREAIGFLAQHEGWLRETLAAMPEAAGERVGLGAVLPVEGVPLRLEPGTGRAVRAEGDRLLVPGDPSDGGVACVWSGSRPWRVTGWPRPRPAMPRRSAAATRN